MSRARNRTWSHSVPPATSAMIAATRACPSRCHGVSNSPIVTGNDDWKTIAPVMLPSARVSLRRRGLVGRNRGAAARGVPLAARLAAADAGACRPTARRAGVPPRARHGVGAASRAGRTRIRRHACCIARRRAPRCTSRPPPRTARGCSAATRYTRRLLGAAVAAHRRRMPSRGCSPRTTEGAYGGGPYADGDLAGDFAWAAPSCGWRRASRRTSGRRAAPCRRTVRRSKGSTATAWPRRRCSTSPCTATTRPQRAGGRDGADRLIALQARPAVGPAVRARRRLGLGLERAHPEQPRRARRRPRARRAPASIRAAARAAWTTCWAATRSARATSPATAPTPRAISARATSPRTSTRRSRRRRPARSPADRRPGPSGFPTDPRLAGLPPQLCYLDEPTSETTNDVCIRWNAPLVWMAAFLTL